MKFRVSDLWRFNGLIERRMYLLAGTLLCVIKCLIDRYVVAEYFGRNWSVFDYLAPGKEALLFSLPSDEQRFYIVMLLISLPFLWIGLALTVMRLRSAALPLWPAVLIFVPIVKVGMFAMLALVVPEANALAARAAQPRPGAGLRLHRWIPCSRSGAAAAAILMPVPLAAGLTALAIYVLRSYGWPVFVGLPFVVSAMSGLIFGAHARRGFGESLLIAWAALLFSGAVLLLTHVEGLVCLAMAAPLAVVVAIPGVVIARMIQSNAPLAAPAPAVVLLILFVPVLLTAEKLNPPHTPLFAVDTEVDVAAPPEKVWQNVVSFRDLAEPDEWLFQMGVAYPLRATIYGHGVGAERHCTFSTGTFVEPITAWDAPRELTFDVTAQPQPMREWSPFGDVHPPHLEGFLVSKAGQFRPTPLPGGGTRLEGTTWYQHNMWPAGYWRLWSDFIIHRIHLRVLDHIRTLAESKT